MTLFNFRKIVQTLVVGIVGGVLGGIFLLPFLVRSNLLNSASLIGKALERKPAVIEKRTIVVSPQNYFSEAIQKVQPAIVAIQSFASGQLIRSGSGVVLTQDGLIATVNSLVPATANFFQVVTGGNIYQAKVLLRDYSHNIAILAVPAKGLQVADLNYEQPKLSQGLLILSKSFLFDKENSFVEGALISRLEDGTSTNGLKQAGFEIKADYDSQLYGASLIDGTGAILGLVDFRNQIPVVIFSKTINDDLAKALTKLQTP